MQPQAASPIVSTATPSGLLEASGVRAVLDKLDAELIGLAPVKGRIRVFENLRFARVNVIPG